MIQGKVFACEIDNNGNIKVATEYTLTDGTKKIGHTRYNFINFTKENVLADVKAHCETLMIKVYGLKKHQALIGEVNLSNTIYKCIDAEVVVKPEIRDTDNKITQVRETIIIDDK